MQRAYLTAFGNPSDVVNICDESAPEAPGPNQVLVDILGASINPAELLLIEGRYATKPPLPAPLGIEGAGRVSAVGPGVKDFETDDIVLCMPRNNWAEQILFSTTEVVRLPREIDPMQAAMLKVNPATALMMLRDMKSLKPGDWVVQNAANSAVGRNLIRIAASMGLKTANLVRRDSLIADLTKEGGDLVLVDGPGVAEQIHEAADGNIALAIDAVGGEATSRLAASLDDEGLIVNYGLLSGERCQLGADQVIFRSISLRGFWLAKELGSMPAADIGELYSNLSGQVIDGKLGVPVEATYPLSQIGAALNHALQDGRDGKILLTPTAI